LQTIPTNSSAKDFDVRKNQPDFFKMLDQRLVQARMSDMMKQAYLDAYSLSEAELIRLDQNVVADDIMHAINSQMFNIKHRKAGADDESYVADMSDIPEMDEFGTILDHAIDNTEVAQEAAKAQMVQSTHQQKRYAGGQISREDLLSMGGQVNRQLDKVLALAYAEARPYFEDAPGFRTTENGDLTSDMGEIYVRSSRGANRDDIAALENAETDGNSRVYGEGDALEETFYEVTDAFIRYLAGLDSWRDIAGGRFEQGAARAYQMKMN